MNKICIDDLWILPTKIDLHELSCPLLSLLMTETCWMLLQTISIKNSLKHFLECLWHKNSYFFIHECIFQRRGFVSSFLKSHAVEKNICKMFVKNGARFKGILMRSKGQFHTFSKMYFGVHRKDLTWNYTCMNWLWRNIIH